MRSLLTEPRSFAQRCWGAVVLMVLVACSGETGGGTGGSAGAGGGGGSDPDGKCSAFCASSALTCSGPDTEAATWSVVTATTATGCSLTVELPFSGTVEVDLDCEATRACVVEADGCLGSPDECYPIVVADRELVGFSYQVPGCLNGSLVCWVD